MESSRVWRRPTLDAVAARAGVSTATVSNALNGTGRLSETTRQRVLATARELGYAPASTARALARGSTGVLGLTMTTYGDLPVSYTEIPYYATLTLSAMAAAHERGYLLLTMPSSMSPWMWLNTPMDGVIHVEPRADDPVGAILRERGIPMVSEGRPPRPRPCDAWVDSDHESGLRLLLDHLAESGARRIGLSLPRHDDAYPHLVAHAYRRWCDEHRSAPSWRSTPCCPTTSRPNRRPSAGCSTAIRDRTPSSASTPTPVTTFSPPLATTVFGCRGTCWWRASARTRSTRARHPRHHPRTPTGPRGHRSGRPADLCHQLPQRCEQAPARGTGADASPVHTARGGSAERRSVTAVRPEEPSPSGRVRRSPRTSQCAVVREAAARVGQPADARRVHRHDRRGRRTGPVGEVEQGRTGGAPVGSTPSTRSVSRSRWSGSGARAATAGCCSRRSRWG